MATKVWRVAISPKNIPTRRSGAVGIERAGYVLSEVEAAKVNWLVEASFCGEQASIRPVRVLTDEGELQRASENLGSSLASAGRSTEIVLIGIDGEQLDSFLVAIPNLDRSIFTKIVKENWGRSAAIREVAVHTTAEEFLKYMGLPWGLKSA